MPMAAKIEAVLCAHLGRPMSVAELSSAIVRRLTADIAFVGERLRGQGRLGRNGANKLGKPYEFFLKNFGELPPLPDAE